MESRRENPHFAKNARLKYCFVPGCSNSALNMPDKIFITVPKGDNRVKWLKQVRREPGSLSLQSTMYCCEDHFDLQEDLENYMRVKSDASAKIRLKKGVLPRFFNCQPDRKRAHAAPARPVVQKLRRTQLLKEIEEEQAANCPTELSQTHFGSLSRNLCTKIGRVAMKNKKETPVFEETSNGQKTELNKNLEDSLPDVDAGKMKEEVAEVENMISVHIKTEMDEKFEDPNPDDGEEVTNVEEMESVHIKTEFDEELGDSDPVCDPLKTEEDFDEQIGGGCRTVLDVQEFKPGCTPVNVKEEEVADVEETISIHVKTELDEDLSEDLDEPGECYNVKTSMNKNEMQTTQEETRKVGQGCPDISKNKMSGPGVESSEPSTSIGSAGRILTPNAIRMRRYREKKRAGKPPKIPKSAAQRAREYRQRKKALRLKRVQEQQLLQYIQYTSTNFSQERL